MSSFDERDTIINYLSVLMDLYKNNKIEKEDFESLKEQVLSSKNINKSKIDYLKQEPNQQSTYLLSMRLDSIYNEISNLIEILKLIETETITQEDEKIQKSIDEMVVQLDGLMHEVIGKILPFYKILDKNIDFRKFNSLYDEFLNNPLSKNNIAYSCEKLRGNLYELEISKTLSDRLPTVSKILKDLHSLSHRWIMKDEPVKLILFKLTKNIETILSNINSYDKLEVALSPSKPSLEKLIDLHKNFPCRATSKIEYVL